jgi:hypothetical protein
LERFKKEEQMKIIEGMKKIKELQVKADDLKSKVSQYCAAHSIETPTYGAAQANKIREWLQGASDSIKEILRLRVAIQKTNILTSVTVELGGKSVTKTIAEWIHRRRDLANSEMLLWSSLGDRNLKEGTIKNSQGDTVDVRIVRYYDPQERDNMVAMFRDEPGRIDSTLEVVNAVTDLME